MNQNKFQKNPFINGNSTSSMNGVNRFSNYDKLGRKTVEEVKQNMIDLKYNHFQEKINNNNNTSQPQPKDVPDFKKRVDMLRKINRG